MSQTPDDPARSRSQDLRPSGIPSGEQFGTPTVRLDAAALSRDFPREGQPYDPAPVREKLRGRLAVWIMILLTVAFDAILFLWGPNASGAGFAQAIIAPLIGITGAVTGFYFASQQTSR